MLSGKVIFSIMAPNYNELWTGYRDLFGITAFEDESKKEGGFLNFVYFSNNMFALPPIPGYHFKIFI